MYGSNIHDNDVCSSNFYSITFIAVTFIPVKRRELRIRSQIERWRQNDRNIGGNRKL